MKRKCIILGILLLSGFCIAQTKLPVGILQEKSMSNYMIYDNEIYCLTYKYTNNCNQNIWFWIDKDDLSKLPDLEKVKLYFVQRKVGSDFSLYEYGIDGNIGKFTPRIFESFIKCIRVNEKFSIEIISKNCITEDIQKKIIYF
jgi:hypothetical protein